MMLVSIEGQAIFQTADCRGPSTIERSNRRDGPGAAGAASVGDASVGGGGATERGGATRPTGLELT
jgi:hypothetical protein